MIVDLKNFNTVAVSFLVGNISVMFSTCQNTEKPFYVLIIYDTDPDKISYYIIEYDIHYDVVNFKNLRLNGFNTDMKNTPLVKDVHLING